MAAHDHLNPDQFVELHRGVSDYNGRTWDGSNRHPSAEAWHAEASEDHPNFGAWWAHDRSMAEFYSGHPHTGVVVSAKFPKNTIRDPKSASGVLVKRGTKGLVTRVTAADNEGTFELPHRPGFTVTS